MGTSSGTKRRLRKPSVDVPDDILELLLPSVGSERGRPNVVTGWLQFFERRYQQTRNPIYAWEAYAHAARARRRVPAWVSEYFLRCADAVHELSRSAIPQGNLPPAIARAFEFLPATHRNPFRTITDTAHDRLIAFEVWKHLRTDWPLDAACQDVADRHATRCDRRPPCRSIHRTTVSEIWHRYRADFGTATS